MTAHCRGRLPVSEGELSLLLSKYCPCIVASLQPLQGPCPSEALTPSTLLLSLRAASPQPRACSNLSYNPSKLPSADTITIATTQASILLLSLTSSTCSLTTISQLPSCWLPPPFCYQVCFSWVCLVGLLLLSYQIPVLHACGPTYCFLGYHGTASPSSPNIADLSCLISPESSFSTCFGIPGISQYCTRHTLPRSLNLYPCFSVLSDPETLRLCVSTPLSMVSELSLHPPAGHAPGRCLYSLTESDLSLDTPAQQQQCPACLEA